MLNGTDFDDYLRVLDPGERLQLLLGYKQDYGGVHLQLRDLEQRALEHPHAGWPRSTASPATPRRSRTHFDRAVYGALTTRLTPDQRLRRRPGRGRAGDHRLPARPGGAADGPRGVRRRQDLHRLPDRDRAGRRRRLHVVADPAAPRRSPATRCVWLDLSAPHRLRRVRRRRPRSAAPARPGSRRRPTCSRWPSPATRSCRSTSAAGSPAPTTRARHGARHRRAPRPPWPPASPAPTRARPGCPAAAP